MNSTSQKTAILALPIDHEIRALVIGTSVQDNDFMREIFEFVRNTSNPKITCSFANSIEEALKQSKSVSFDVVLFEISYPSKMIQKNVCELTASFPNAPIVALTTLDLDIMSLNLPATQFQDYLAIENLDSNFLIQSIYHAIERNRMQLELQEQKRALKANEEQLQTIVHSTLDAILVVSDLGEIKFANPAGEKMFGRSQAELLQWKFPFKIESNLVEVAVLREKQESILAEMRATKTMWGAVSAYLVTMRDITENKMLQAKWEQARELERHLAYHDPLTGLPNRQLFYDRIRQALAHARRNQSKFAILFLDLDGFKEINDFMGHSNGDLLLTQVADRLKKSIRAMDTVARLGGDEFVMILSGLKQDEDAAIVARKTISMLERGFQIGQETIEISTSIGIAIFPRDGESGETLLKNADSAMYRAKSAGKSIYNFYHMQADEHTKLALSIEKSLTKGLEKKQFEVVYQSRLDAATGMLHSLQALVRWHHPELGILEPEKFIHAAQNSDFIIDLDKFVIESAVREFVETGVQHALSVHVSCRTLRSTGFPTHLKKILTKYNFSLELFSLDLGGSRLHISPDQVRKQLARLKKLGVRLTLDDFGLHAFPLVQLISLPFDTYKITQYLSSASAYQKHQKKLAALIALSHHVGKSVLVTHIQTQKQEEFFNYLNVDFLQGFLYDLPGSLVDVIGKSISLPNGARSRFRVRERIGEISNLQSLRKAFNVPK